MIIDYEALVAMAKSIGRSVKDLIALAPQHDPFFAGRPHRVREAEWFANVVWAKYGAVGMNPRRAHYLLLSTAITTPDGSPYENTKKCLTMLISASLTARYLDLVPFDALGDARNEDRKSVV